MVSQGTYSGAETGGYGRCGLCPDFIINHLWSFTSLPVRVEMGHYDISREFIKLSELAESAVRPLLMGKE